MPHIRVWIKIWLNIIIKKDVIGCISPPSSSFHSWRLFNLRVSTSAAHSLLCRAGCLISVMSIMESTSNQAIDSDESERKLQVAGRDEHELADNDLSKNVDLCTGEVDMTLEQSIESLPSRDNVIEPYIGMEFTSRDDAREFYAAYGRRTGFTIRIHHNRRSRINNMVISQDYVCSKEGFRGKKYMYRNDRVLPQPPITREGCPAIIRLAFRDGDKWVVTKFVNEHNHELMSPSKVLWRGSTEIPSMLGDKDKKIEVLTLELERHDQLCVAYREKLLNLMNNVEEQNEELSSKIQGIVENIRKAESEMSP